MCLQQGIDDDGTHITTGQGKVEPQTLDSLVTMVVLDSSVQANEELHSECADTAPRAILRSKPCRAASDGHKAPVCAGLELSLCGDLEQLLHALLLLDSAGW